jgi:hypothetical protein
MRPAAITTAAAALLAATTARADPLDLFDPPHATRSIGADVCRQSPVEEDLSAYDEHVRHRLVVRQESTLPGFFNGIGTPCRYWEARSDTAFDTHRVFTQHFELARAFTIRRYLTAVARVGFGAEADTTESFYSIQPPIVSLGVRDRSPSADYWAEFGIRVIPNISGPNDTDPRRQQLALAATLSSGIADDAAWLPFSDFGWQLYGAFQARTPRWAGRYGTVFFGLVWGGQASLTPMSVRSWLGPQTGFIGNAFVDFFLGAPVIAHAPANLELGLHGEISLSSIWPGDELFPALANLFVAWSPKSWFAVRAFAGVAGSPVGPPPGVHYGTRLEFYVP